MKIESASQTKAKYPFKKIFKPVALSISTAAVLSGCASYNYTQPKVPKTAVAKKEGNTAVTEPVEPAIAGYPDVEPVNPGMSPVGSCNTNTTNISKSKNVKPFTLKK